MPYQEYLWIFVWAFAAIALIGLEIATTALVSIWFAVGALAAFITAIATDAVWVQLVVFAVVSTLMLVLTRPFAKRFLKERKTATNADSLIGKSCVVVQQVGPEDAVGRVKQGDIFWLASANDPKETFVPGEHARIAAISGNRLCLVKDAAAE